jgi:D-alanine-D-alanine ligase
VKKTKVLILFGGRSTEHEISIDSARNVIQAMDKQKYEPILVGISKESGTWYYFSGSILPNAVTVVSDRDGAIENIVNLRKIKSSVDLMNDDGTVDMPIDFILPILHGKYGEDGCLQGLCRMFNLPFAGPSVASSAVCMDKDFTKRILQSVQIPMGPYMTFYKNDDVRYDDITAKLGSCFFLKPANTGSSVGIYKVKSKADFDKYIPILFQYDEKIIVEKYIQGKEIECAVLGNHTPIASILGEIKPNHEFYSYESKYIDPNGADLIIPASVDADTAKKVQQYALIAYKTMGCKGFSRVDFFVTFDNEIYFNEINTIPGFTNISMYPKLFEASGISYTNLISRIIDLGQEDYRNWLLLSTEHHLL